jgi:hypothetical protein
MSHQIKMADLNCKAEVTVMLEGSHGCIQRVVALWQEVMLN